MRKIIICGLGTAIMLASIIVSGKHDGKFLRDISLNYQTSHLDWGGGKKNGLKALFIVARKGGREVVEVLQRFPMEYEAVTTVNASTLAVENMYEGSVEGTSVYEKKHELLKKLEKKYDLFILGNFNFEKLPPEVQFKILSQVSDGAGLLIIYPRKIKLKKIFSRPLDAGKEILALAPIDGLPEKVRKIHARQLLKTYRFGKGRIACIDYKSNHGAHYGGMSLTAPNYYSNRWQAEYENSMILLMRSMYWASGGKFAPLVLPDLSKPLLQKSVKLKIKCGGNCNLTARVRNEHNQIKKEYKKDVLSQTEIAVPILPGGKYYLDFILKNQNGELVNFGSRPFEVKAETGRVSLSTNGKDVFAKKENIKVELKTENSLDEKALIILELADSPYGHVWDKKEFELKAGQTKLEMEFNNAYIPTIAGYLKCSVIKNGNKIAVCEKLLFFPNRKLETYMALCWSLVPGQYLGTFYARQIVDKLGWRAGLSHPRSDGKGARAAALLNQRFVPYTVRVGIQEDKKKKGWTKQYSWFFLPRKGQKKMKEISDQSFYNPEVRDAWKNGVEYRIKNIVKYGPAIYTLGDENHLNMNAGFTPSDNAEFTIFLKNRYVTIDKLNKIWESSYKSFDDVPHYTLQAAKNKKIFPAWLDHRKFMEKQYADIHHFLAEKIKKIDPDAIVGAEGSVPGNLEQTVKGLEFWGPYSNLVMDEVLRSLAPEKIRMLWWGGYVGSHKGRNKYPSPLWKDLLAGTVNGNMWFSASIAGPESALGSDMDFPAYLKALIPYLDKLRFGIAQLLIKTPLKNDGVAILWGHASDSVRLLDSRFVNTRDSIGAFIKYCYQTGLNFNFVTENMMNNGALDKCKVLFLFGASSISRNEAAMIKSFAEKGGLVIADINPGLLDRFCCPFTKNPLSGLFGNVVYSNLKEPVLAKVSIDTTLKGKKIRFEALKALSTPGIPLFQVRKVGKGEAVLLNFSLSAASNTASAKTPLAGFISELLAMRNVSPGIKVEDGKIKNSIIKVRSGKGFDIIGIFVDGKDIGKKIKITIPKTAYIYEVDEKFIARANKWNVNFNIPFKLYCAFKEKPVKPEFSLSPTNTQKGGIVELKLKNPASGGVYFISISDPGGNAMPLRNLVIDEVPQKTRNLHFAFNDKAGEYTITVKDVRSGLVSKEKIKVY